MTAILDLIFATSEQGRGGLWLFPGLARRTGSGSRRSRFRLTTCSRCVSGMSRVWAGWCWLSPGKSLRLFAWDSGSLAEKKTIPLGGSPVPFMADLDQDQTGRPGGSRRRPLRRSCGESRTGRPIEALWLPTLAATDVVVADLNGDDRPEIAFANQFQGSHGDLDVSSYVYWGESWGYGPESRTDLQTFGATAVAAGDIDRDGRLDLLFGNSGSGIQGGRGEEVYVYWGRPHRGYSPAAMTAYPCVMGMATLMADLDDDDHAELLVANSGRHYSGQPGASYIYRGAELRRPGLGGSAGSSRRRRWGPGPWPTSIATASWMPWRATSIPWLSPGVRQRDFPPIPNASKEWPRPARTAGW